MRTIKFRGKKVTNGVWAYGSLVYLDENGAAILARVLHTILFLERHCGDLRSVPSDKLIRKH